LEGCCCVVMAAVGGAGVVEPFCALLIYSVQLQGHSGG